MRLGLWGLLAGVVFSTSLLTACAEDDSGCDAETTQALGRMPARLEGSISLTYQGQTIIVPITVRTQASGCGLSADVIQNLNSECGDEFSGSLTFQGDSVWKGSLSSTETENTTTVDVTLTTRSATSVEFTAEIKQSPSDLCRGQKLFGDLSAQ